MKINVSVESSEVGLLPPPSPSPQLVGADTTCLRGHQQRNLAETTGIYCAGGVRPLLHTPDTLEMQRPKTFGFVSYCLTPACESACSSPNSSKILLLDRWNVFILFSSLISEILTWVLNAFSAHCFMSSVTPSQSNYSSHLSASRLHLCYRLRSEDLHVV